MKFRSTPALRAVLTFMAGKPYQLLLAGVVISSAFGGTVNLSSNFNAANNPSANAAFSYGAGSTSAGFAALTVLTPNCFGQSPTLCLDGPGAFPNSASMTWNGTAVTLSSGTVTDPPNFVRMDPQGLGAILRYTAPVSGSYSVAFTWEGADTSQHTDNGALFANGVQQGATQTINSQSDVRTYNASFSLNAGQTIDFIVTAPGASFDSSALGGTITTPGGGATTPEPGTFALLGLGSLAFGVRALRGRKRR